MTGLTRVRNRGKDFLYVLALAMQTTYLAKWVQLDMLYDHQRRGTADAKIEVPAQPPLGILAELLESRVSLLSLG